MKLVESPETSRDSVALISEQYQTVVGILDYMFQVARIRTAREEWRFDGVGSCAQITGKMHSEIGLLGPVREHLISLREARNQQVGGQSELTSCPYHRTDRGCTLGDLKAPICISYFDGLNRIEWKRNFNLEPTKLQCEITESLGHILKGHYLNSSATKDYTEKITSDIKKIEQAPILYGSSMKDKVRILWRDLRCFPRQAYRHWMWMHA